MQKYTENPFQPLSAKEYNCAFGAIEGVEPHTCLLAERMSKSLAKSGEQVTAGELLDLPQKEFNQLQTWFNEVNS